MRAVFINHCHPDTSHVCALRVTSFAKVLASQGHQIILFSETLSVTDPGQDPATLAGELSGHDWATPFVVAVRPAADPLLPRLRSGRLPPVVRQAVIAGYYLFRSGLFGDWRRAAVPHLTVISRSFRPQVIWASFGNSDVWNIARDLSAIAECPWVADIKDNWQNFIPYGLRKLLSRRYHDAVAMTTFSNCQRDEAAQWFGQTKSTVYSGYDLTAADRSTVTDSPRFKLVLTGSIYSRQHLQTISDALASFLRAHRNFRKTPMLFVYAGSDGAQVSDALRTLGDDCEQQIYGYLPMDDLRHHQQTASLNLYIRKPGKFIFHHKLIELLAAGKPILCFPEEIDEARRIADEVGGVLYSCATQADIKAVLTQSMDREASAGMNRAIDTYSWQGQSVILEKVLADARRTPCR